MRWLFLSRRAYQRWFYAAALYNLLWGAWVSLFPGSLFSVLRLDAPSHLPLWQSVGMMVQVYAFGYYLIARQPERYAALVWVGLAGKTFGPLGFLYASSTGQLAWAFGWTLIFNDLMWWPVFWTFALKYARRPFDSCGEAMEQGHDRQS